MVAGLSMLLIDGNGCPLSRPEAVSASYAVTDEKSLAGMPVGRCSRYAFVPDRKLPAESVRPKCRFYETSPGACHSR